MSILTDIATKIGTAIKSLTLRVNTLEQSTELPVSTITRTISFSDGVWYDLIGSRDADIDTSITSFIELGFYTYAYGGSIYNFYSSAIMTKLVNTNATFTTPFYMNKINHAYDPDKVEFRIEGTSDTDTMTLQMRINGENSSNVPITIKTKPIW